MKYIITDNNGNYIYKTKKRYTSTGNIKLAEIFRTQMDAEKIIKNAIDKNMRKRFVVQALPEEVSNETEAVEADPVIDEILEPILETVAEETIENLTDKLIEEKIDEVRKKATKIAKKIIDDANNEKNKIEDEKKLIEDNKDKLIEDYKKEAKELICEEAREACKDIREKAEDDQTKAGKLKEEYETKLKRLAEKDKDFAQKFSLLLEEQTKLDVKKNTYKSETITEEVDRQQEIDKLQGELTEKENEIKKLRKTLEAASEDKLALERELEQNYIRRTDIMTKELDAKRYKSDSEVYKARVEQIQKELSEKDVLIGRYGENPQAIIDENLKLKRELDQINDQIANCPSAEEIDSLREIAQQVEQKNAEILDLRNKWQEADDKYQNAKLYQEDIDNYKRFIRVLELQKAELQKELDRIIDTYNNKKTAVFSSLSKIDKEDIPAAHSMQNVTLKDICKGFRAYMANRKNNPLYYSEKHVRTFVAGFAATRLMILEGMSGTGKSSLPKAFAEYTHSVTENISVQSSWKDRNDLLGFYNDFEKRYKETKFLKELYKATRDNDNIHCIMLDEMNLSRIEYYFADFLSTLEEENPDKWEITLIPDEIPGEMPEYIVDGNLQVMTNTWFIGTANNDDSTSIITDKVYDRAIVLNFPKREKEFSIAPEKPIYLSNTEFQDLLKNAKKKCKDPDGLKQLVNDLDDSMITLFEISFGNRISNQIRDFVATYESCGGTMLEAIDIIFATKVLRKLQGYYDESTKKGLSDLLTYLETTYSKNDFELSKEAIKKMQDKLG